VPQPKLGVKIGVGVAEAFAPSNRFDPIFEALYTQ
jgi:hypothetical protein